MEGVHMNKKEKERVNKLFSNLFTRIKTLKKEGYTDPENIEQYFKDKQKLFNLEKVGSLRAKQDVNAWAQAVKSVDMKLLRSKLKAPYDTKGLAEVQKRIKGLERIGWRFEEQDIISIMDMIKSGKTLKVDVIEFSADQTKHKMITKDVTIAEDLTEEVLKNIAYRYVKEKRKDGSEKYYRYKGSDYLRYTNRVHLKIAAAKMEEISYESYFNKTIDPQGKEIASTISRYQPETQQVLRELDLLVKEKFKNYKSQWARMWRKGMLPRPGQGQEYKEKVEKILELLGYKPEDFIKMLPKEQQEAFRYVLKLSAHKIDKINKRANLNSNGRVVKNAKKQTDKFLNNKFETLPKKGERRKDD